MPHSGGMLMKILRCIVKLLVIIGALNWGLVGFFDYNLVGDIFGGEASTGARVVFSIVGLAGLFWLARFCCKCCRGGKCGCGCGCGSSCGCSKGSCGTKHQ